MKSSSKFVWAPQLLQLKFFFFMRRSDIFYCMHWLIYTKILTINFLDEQVYEFVMMLNKAMIQNDGEREEEYGGVVNLSSECQ